MRILVESALSPNFGQGLAAAGNYSIHERDLGIKHVAGEIIFRPAQR